VCEVCEADVEGDMEAQEGRVMLLRGFEAIDYISVRRMVKDG
jgi:hypothetical protein